MTNKHFHNHDDNKLTLLYLILFHPHNYSSTYNRQSIPYIYQTILLSKPRVIFARNKYFFDRSHSMF